jgi:hypothetical protein
LEVERKIPEAEKNPEVGEIFRRLRNFSGG